MDFAIETQAVRKKLGRLTERRDVIRGCDLRVPTGEVYGFIGPNGAGKTTMMRLLLGILRADSGTISLLGHDMRKNPRAALRQTGAFVESPALYDHLTATANLAITCRLLRLPEREIDRVLDVVDMAGHAQRKVRDYSLGMRQRVGLARALIGQPKLLLLDEPTNGLDPEGIAEMRGLIRDLPDRIGATVFVSSHLLGEIEQVADHAGLLRKGRLVMQGTLKELLGDQRVLIARVDQPEQSLRLLKLAGYDPELLSWDRIALASAPEEEFDSFAMRINGSLVQAGIGVSEIGEQKRSLEDLYKTTAGAGLKGIAA